MKVGIVGADGLNPAWTPEREIKTDKVIRQILHGLHPTKPFTFGTFKDLTLVSGHCPVGEERWYCVDCNKWLPITDGKTTFSICRMSHNVVKVFDKGGVDTMVEIIATELGIQKEIYAPEVKQWDDWNGSQCNKCGFIDAESQMEFQRMPVSQREYLMQHKEKCGGSFVPFTKKGYRSRNIDIVNAIPNPPNGVLYDIEPKGSCKHCGGSGLMFLTEEQTKRKLERLEKTGIPFSLKCRYCLGTGNYSGGTRTLRYAEKLGKETHLVVVE